MKPFAYKLFSHQIIGRPVNRTAPLADALTAAPLDAAPARRTADADLF